MFFIWLTFSNKNRISDNTKASLGFLDALTFMDDFLPKRVSTLR